MHDKVLAAGENFLIPNGTFIGELVIFAIVLLVIWRCGSRSPTSS